DLKTNQTLQRPTLFGGRRILLQCGRSKLHSVMFSSFSARTLSGSARRARFPDLECASSNEENAIPHSGLASPMGNSGFLIWAVLPNEKNRWGRARSRAEIRRAADGYLRLRCFNGWMPRCSMSIHKRVDPPSVFKSIDVTRYPSKPNIRVHSLCD